MFDFFKSIKKVINPTQKINTQIGVEVKKDEAASESGLDKKINQFTSFLGATFEKIHEQFISIKEKSKDLSSTNYNLGLQHLENGNLKEAIFRFKITKKFWPDNSDAYYQLIICLILSRKFDEAQKAIDELLTKNPSYQEKINKLLGSDNKNQQKQVQNSPDANQNL